MAQGHHRRAGLGASGEGRAPRGRAALEAGGPGWSPDFCKSPLLFRGADSLPVRGVTVDTLRQLSIFVPVGFELGIVH